MNELTEKNGLSLTRATCDARGSARTACVLRPGELGAGACRVDLRFCDSPYLLRTESRTLAALQELFSRFKNEYGDAFSATS
jgi:hypothetical protein